MPLYEYRCGQCGRLTEKIQKFSDPELTVCPHCGGALERTLTAPAVHFSGGGWYKDLYSSAKPAAAPGSEKAGSDAGTNTGSGDAATPASEGGGTSTTAPNTTPPAAAPPATSSTSGASKP